MKMNCWLTLAAMVALNATAQNSTNALPEIPAPAPAVAPTTQPAEPSAPAAKKAPAKKTTTKHTTKKHKAAAPAKKIAEAPVTLNPGPATVIQPKLNVRGQAGLKGEVVAHLAVGDTVTVISQINLDKHAAGEPAQWAKIALPAKTKVWVNTKFIDEATKTVKSRKLNLRAGPGENYSVIGVLEHGASVTPLDKKGDWTHIETPASAYAFVAAMYLKQEPSAAVATTTPTPAPETQPTPTPVPESQPINTQPTMPMPTTQPAPVVSPETGIPGGMDNSNQPRVVTHEGMVRHVASIIAPTAYELYDPATFRAIDYLYSTTTNLDLSKYDGFHIIVTGEEGLAERWKDQPVLTVEKIIVIEAPAEKPKYQSAAPSRSGHH